ncbi:MAG: hypothetical protein WC498_02570 [Candidatus Saccharimonadales bacterium]
MSDVTPIKSICILGRQPSLGLAELESLYGSSAVSLVSPHAAGLTLGSADVDFRRLGGSTRLCTVLAELPSTDWKKVELYLINNVSSHIQHVPDGKLKLGLSAVGIAVSPGKLIASGLTLKKVLRKSGRSVRLVPNQTTELSTAQVLHNNLTENLGCEFVAIATDRGTTLLAQTVSVQDINSYTVRDRGRPKRDARVGMLPPKLAQIIINLAVGNTNPLYGAVVLDPFCGTGVILQESMLMDFTTYGTDLEQRMIDYSKANQKWLHQLPQEQLPPHGMDNYYRVEVGDATSHIWQLTGRLDFVATETYLGRPFTTQPSGEILARTVSECSLIIKKFLKNIHGQLPPGTRLCVAVPAWQTRPGIFKHLPVVDSLEEMGYNRVSFEHVLDEQLLYYREDQIVARELLVLTRK